MFGAAQIFLFFVLVGSDEASQELTVNFAVPPTEINQEHQYKRYDNNFPVPKLENVYKAWKPVDHGHPLRDETLFYAPPSMERVRFQHENQGPQSRSIDDEVFTGGVPKGPIVIPAEPKKEPQNHGYSVYGSPDINYSALYYNQPAVKLPTHDSPRPDGRENPYLAFQRDYQTSALDSRSADTRDYPLLWGNQLRRKDDSALEPVSKISGLQMIKPRKKTKKKPTEYFYYSEDSAYYKEILNKKPNKEDHEEGNEIISIDGIVVGPKKDLPKPEAVKKPPTSYPEDLVPQASEHHVRQPEKPTKANAVVYSFKNNYGQREHVGVIYDEEQTGPQVSKVLPSNKHFAQPRHDRGHNHYDHKQNLANFIPLEKKPAEQVNKGQEQSFPLGNPFVSPLLKARPEYFPPLQYPPLYKTRPTKLEGSFGPALPPKPEPDVILFADEELPGVVREEPKKYNRRQYQQPQARQVPIHTVGQGREEYVYKTVRDMDYSRPKDILSVRPSGELYIPDPGTENAPLGDASPRVPILPGVSTLEEWETIQEDQKQQEIDDRLWQPDFSDVLQQKPQQVPSLSDVFGAGINQPLDLETGSSVADQVVFQDNSYAKPGSSFKFPGKSTSDQRPQNNRQPPPIHRKPSGAVKIQRPQGIQKPQEPNYKVVIGLTYDDAGPDLVSQDYESDYSETQTSEQFGKDQLYDICIEEVPKHLHRDLCGYIKDGKVPPSRESGKNIQPRPAKLIQGPKVLPGQFVQNGFEVRDFNPFAGIPTELPKQISQDEKQPMVITSNSKVKIYKPFEDAPVTIEPVTQPPTTTVPVTVPTLPSTTSTIRNRNRRPLLYNKRDPNTGETKTSKPFEYLTRLTQFFSNRIQSKNNGSITDQRRLPPPPRLQRHRLRLPPMT